MTVPTLTTDRLILRAPRPEDFETYTAFYASPRSLFVGGPRERLENWFTFLALGGHWALKGFGYWMVERRDTGALIGSLGIIEHDGWPEPELGWQLFDAAFEGQGYAREGAMAARDWAAGRGMGPLISLIHPLNEQSVALARRLGAVEEGSFDSPFGALTIWRHPLGGRA